MKEAKIILPVFRTVQFPVARKAWRCSLCGRPVEEGKRYAHFFARHPHGIDSFRFHPGCFHLVMGYCEANQRTDFKIWSIRKWLLQNGCGECKDRFPAGTLTTCKRLSSCPAVAKFVKLKNKC